MPPSVSCTVSVPDDLPEHRRNATWHSTHYRLHRLLLPPRSAPPATWRRPSAPALPAPPARRRPSAPRTPARSRTVASSQSWATRRPAGPSQGRVSVGVLAGGGLDAGGRWPADPLLVTPLIDQTSEPTFNSTLTETLYGRADPFSRGRPSNEHVRHPPASREYTGAYPRGRPPGPKPPPEASRPLLSVVPSCEETTKRYPVVCTAEAYHGKGISSLYRSRLRISIASDAATNLRRPLGLRRMNLEAVGPSCGLLMPPTGP